MTRDKILWWVQERLDNCQSIASVKKGVDREGWMEDASYFAAILSLLTKDTNGGTHPPMPTSIGNPHSDWMLSSHNHGNCEVCDELERKWENQRFEFENLTFDLKAALTKIIDFTSGYGDIAAIVNRIARDALRRTPLVVGEPCAGKWIGPPDASLRQWSCECGAANPALCKTETAKP